MRFKRWPRVEAYVDTSRKRAAFHRSQKAKRNKFPLLAPLISTSRRTKSRSWSTTYLFLWFVSIQK